MREMQERFNAVGKASNVETYKLKILPRIFRKVALQLVVGKISA